MEVKIDKEQIEKYLATALLDSALGDHIETAINDCLKERYSSNNVVAVAVRSAVSERIKRMVGEGELAQKIEYSIRQKLDDELLEKLITKFVESLSISHY